MHSRADIARQLVHVCHRLAEKGFVTATDGNVSARLSSGNILTTPTALNKGRVTESDLVEITRDGKPMTFGRRPSTEIDMHLFIYRERPDVHAVVHAHPTYATGFATARIPLTDCLFPEVIVGLGAVPLAPYATPSTREVTDSLVPFVQQTNAIMLANHGVVTYGADLDDAYFNMEKVEHAAHIAFVAHMLGGPQLLTSEQVERLRTIAQSSYGKDVTGMLECRTARQIGAAPAERSDASEEEVKQLIREVLTERLRKPITLSQNKA
ncbi:MAG: class II aldolase/adducin family protein [Ignavibacteria bacterium]|nr:class II aldolase/adducin family protein [Ignavibacteria bacterium]